MIVNTSEMLHKAQQGAYAVPQFNINNLEWAKYILEVCEVNHSPVILGVSEGAAKYMGGYKTVYGMISGLLSDLGITIPVALHLDHGKTVESCKKAVDAGFTSVMIDGSSYPLDQNIEMTSDIVLYAHSKNVTVEAEVGHIGGAEDSTESSIAYARLEDCVTLAEKTNIDSLAPALGSVHGLYKGEAKIDIDRMLLINEAVSAPLVLHGGTGISSQTITRAINAGICKININTELQIVWSSAVRNFLNNDAITYDPRKVIGSGEKAIKQVISEKIILFGSNNRV
ncbi:MAG: class II fructose-1,6-bisphosphate aldolase [Bacilli bacterium]|jgi:fructose-1,6-bisphosphate aldolase class II